MHKIVFVDWRLLQLQIIIIIIIIIVIIIIIIIISFMQGIYRYISETNDVLGNTVFHLFCHYYLWCLYR